MFYHIRFRIETDIGIEFKNIMNARNLDDGLIDYVVGHALQEKLRGRKIALVSLVSIEQSSPRLLGAQMAIADNGRTWGYLSGGCVEQAVISEALDAIKQGQNRLVRYGQGSDYIDIHLPCGSSILLYFDVGISFETLQKIDDCYQKRIPAYLSFDIDALGIGQYRRARKEQGQKQKQEQNLFHRLYLPALRLVVIGFGPVAIQLVRLGVASGLDVVFVTPNDDDEALCQSLNITIYKMAGRDLPANIIDNRTALAVIFHDHDWEQHIWQGILASEAFYIGAMGSQQSHKNRVAMLEAQGVKPKDIARIFAPAGLFIGGKSAYEIAISILAQMIAMKP